VLKQRNALLKQMGGRRSPSRLTLDVWDERLAALGERMARCGPKLVDQLAPVGAGVHRRSRVSGPAVTVGVHYAAPAWRGDGLAARPCSGPHGDDIRRGVSTVGPHRDDLDVRSMVCRADPPVAGRAALAGVGAATRGRTAWSNVRTGEAPVLFLDDVFSELDERRSSSVARELPAVQKMLTTAATLPPGARPDVVMRIANSRTTVRHPDDGGHPRS
jgi:DNA replication and repair protein RecF